eukprot:3853330-Ditylum_brightwellii.AAC.1
MAQNLPMMHLLAAMTPENDVIADHDELEDQWRQLHDSLLQGAESQHKEFLGTKKKDVAAAAKHLTNFATWL